MPWSIQIPQRHFLLFTIFPFSPVTATSAAWASSRASGCVQNPQSGIVHIVRCAKPQSTVAPAQKNIHPAVSYPSEARDDVRDDQPAFLPAPADLKNRARRKLRNSLSLKGSSKFFPQSAQQTKSIGVSVTKLMLLAGFETPKLERRLLTAPKNLISQYPKVLQFAPFTGLCQSWSPQLSWVELAPEVEALESALWNTSSTSSFLVNTAKGIENVSQPIPSTF
jgi:hypothetical protein